MLIGLLRSACDKETEGRFGDRRSSMGRSVSHFFFFLAFFGCCTLKNPPHLLLPLQLQCEEEETLNTSNALFIAQKSVLVQETKCWNNKVTWYFVLKYCFDWVFLLLCLAAAELCLILWHGYHACCYMHFCNAKRWTCRCSGCSVCMLFLHQNSTTPFPRHRNKCTPRQHSSLRCTFFEP